MWWRFLVCALVALAACGGNPAGGGPDAGAGICGDGKIDAHEECDDGARNSDTTPDACRTSCLRAKCGDQVVDTGEACDGRAPRGATCTPSCHVTICGNGLVEEGEQCDDGDRNSDTHPGACRGDCTRPRCGDGVIDAAEGCDDGNAAAGDGCSPFCQPEGVKARKYEACTSLGATVGGLVCVDAGQGARWFSPCAGGSTCRAPWEACVGEAAKVCVPHRCAAPFEGCEGGTCLPVEDPTNLSGALCVRSGGLAVGARCEGDLGDSCAAGLACIARSDAPLVSCASDADCETDAGNAYCSLVRGRCEPKGQCEDFCDPLRATDADAWGCDDDRAVCVPVGNGLGACRIVAPAEGEACLHAGASVGGFRCVADAGGALRWLRSCVDATECRPFQRCDSVDGALSCVTSACSGGAWGACDDGTCLETPEEPHPACWRAGTLAAGEACRNDATAPDGLCAAGLACLGAVANGAACAADDECHGGYCDRFSHRCAATGTCRAPCDVTGASGSTCAVLGESAACVPSGVSGLGVCAPEGSGDDPFFVKQWHLAQTSANGTHPGEDANVAGAWAQGIRGEGVTIGIVDDGLEIGHEDLVANVIPGLSHDYVTGGTDPTGGDHGTSVAGVAAARDLNGKGVRGVAPRAALVGFNLLSSDMSANELDAETRLGDVVDVYNNSWGPPDGSAQLVPSEPLWRQAIEHGLAHGRGGRGSIYVWAGGNGGEYGEDSNYDGYANFRGVMAICAVGADGHRASYSERGANLWICTPSEGNDRVGITTTDRSGALGYNDGAPRSRDLPDAHYTNSFGGTSSATPVAAGAAALVLQANPRLTWRDVRLVLATTARKNHPASLSWTTNGAGFHVSHDYGFGVVDVSAAVAAARTWPLLPPMKTYETTVMQPHLAIPDDDRRGVQHQVRLSGTGISSIEYVAIRFTSDHEYAGDLEIVLTNETTGTESILATQHECAGPCAPYDDWRFGSARHLGESADGIWSLAVRDTSARDTGSFASWQLVFYGH